MNTAENLTALQIACDLYTTERLTVRPDGSFYMAWRGPWPEGATDMDISESIYRVKAHRMRARADAKRAAQAYADATPTESMVIRPAKSDPIRPDDIDPSAPTWIDNLLFAAAVTLSLTWVGLAIVGLMFVCGALR